MKYDYKCTKCDSVQEIEHKMSETPEVKCEHCGEHTEKTFLTAAPIHKHGHGWTRKFHP